MLAEKMVSPEEQPTKSSRPAPPRNPGGSRRRGHRGGRGRGPRRNEPVPAVEPPGSAPRETVPSSPSPVAETAADASAISQAVEEVTQIVESLKQTLNQMEEVLELVELAERQKLADEREVESLRRALHKIHQPRGERREQSQQND
jgi:hypothetical protein